MQDYVRWLIDAGWHVTAGPGEPDERGMATAYTRIRHSSDLENAHEFGRPSLDEALAAAVSHSRQLGVEA